MPELDKPKSVVLDPAERSRTYTFPGHQDVTLEGVTEIAVSPSGTHRLKTSDGRLHIVPVGWIHIEIDASDWTF